MELVSIHGGHSGQFCSHATDSLESIVQEYINQGFQWVGITEHTPPWDIALLYPDQRENGETPELLYTLFVEYFKNIRELQRKYVNKIKLYAAMEIETCSGYQEFIPELRKEFQPDYIVGSVHHCCDIPFDFSLEYYQTAAKNMGSIDALYLHYFDEQYAMIESLQPEVIGHFDLIRIFDDDYSVRFKKKEIWKRIERNLELIAKLGLILDYNQRALTKGAKEPYITKPILSLAKEMGIIIVPGDDSHSVATVGKYIKEASERLVELGGANYAQAAEKRICNSCF